jgi:cysteine desulfurase
VLEVMLPYFSEKFGNAASKTHAFGWTAADAVEQARERVTQLINAETQEILFTSGSTEAINLAIKGVFEAYRSKGNHIVTISTEHKAVLDTCLALEKRGANISYLKVDRHGNINLQELSDTITPQTILVCAMYANNETGLIHPVKAISDVVHSKASILMCDATQAVGKIPVNVREDGIDLLCLSAHKFYGPKGTGALYVRRKNPRVALLPLIDGGGHERGLRSGTLNVPGIAGLGKACEIAGKEMEQYGKRISTLRGKLENALTITGKIQINCITENRIPNTSNLLIEGVKADSLVKELCEIAFSAGSACTSANPEPSHVLRAMGLSEEEAYSSIRLSLGKFTTEEEIDFVIEKMAKIFKGIISRKAR